MLGKIQPFCYYNLLKSFLTGADVEGYPSSSRFLSHGFPHISWVMNGLFPQIHHWCPSLSCLLKKNIVQNDFEFLGISILQCLHEIVSWVAKWFKYFLLPKISCSHVEHFLFTCWSSLLQSVLAMWIWRCFSVGYSFPHRVQRMDILFWCLANILLKVMLPD